MRRPGTLFSLVLIVGLVLPGCSQPRGDGEAEDTEEPGSGLRVGSPAPEIEGVDLDGQGMALSDYRGKVVLLSFWMST